MMTTDMILLTIGSLMGSVVIGLAVVILLAMRCRKTDAALAEWVRSSGAAGHPCTASASWRTTGSIATRFSGGGAGGAAAFVPGDTAEGPSPDPNRSVKEAA